MGDSIKSHLACRHIDRRHRNDVLADRRQVREQLWMRWALSIPIRSFAPSTLVVEDCAPASLKGIETVDTHLHLRTGERQRLLELCVQDAEWIAAAFENAQFLDEANRA